MKDLPKMTDTAGWSQHFLETYRRWPAWLLFLNVVISLPFCFIVWAAQRGEAMMQILSGEDE